MHATEPSYARYVAVSSVVIAVAIGGMLAAGTLAAREHEEGTLKILLLTLRRSIQQAAHVAAGMVLGLIPTGLVLAFTVLLLRLRLAHLGELILAATAVLLVFVAISNLVRVRLPVAAAMGSDSLVCRNRNLTLRGQGEHSYPCQWEHPVIATAAHFSPTYYGLALFLFILRRGIDATIISRQPRRIGQHGCGVPLVDTRKPLDSRLTINRLTVHPVSELGSPRRTIQAREE